MKTFTEQEFATYLDEHGGSIDGSVTRNLTSGVVAVDDNPDQRALLNSELEDIKKWFADHDYYVNKIITGEWTSDDERWQSYLAERISKRNRYDEIMQLLN